MYLEYSCKTKNIVLGINWCLIQPNRDIALLQFNMMSTQIANVEWKREQETIEDLKILYERDEKKTDFNKL